MRITLSLWRGLPIVAGPYDAGGYYPDMLPSSQVLMRFVFVRTVVFPAGLYGSQASAGTAATAQTDLDIQLNGASQGTMRFTAGQTVGTFVGVGPMTCAAGDVLTVVAPASADATLSHVGFMFKGTRG